MNPILVATTALLVVAFIAFAIGTWRVYRGHSPTRPLIEYVVAAMLFAWVGWEAVTWLRVDHPDVAVGRYLAVWLQLATSFGLVILMLVLCWLAKTRQAGDRLPRTS